MSLYLLPNLLSDESSIQESLPPILPEILKELDGFICENLKEGRKYLSRFIPSDIWKKIPMHELNEHTSPTEIVQLSKKVKENQKWALISDAGLPCLSDPGSSLIYQLKKQSIEVHSIPGPSAIITAILLSGLLKESFYYHGYLPRKEGELIQKLHTLEKESERYQCLQVWIEAPYRAGKHFQQCLRALNPQTELSITMDVGTTHESSRTLTVQEWKKINLPPKFLGVFALLKSKKN